MTPAQIFNEMAEDYDNIRDLWYSWLFSRLHLLIAKYVILPYAPKTVLDVGCGTGFQTFLHAGAGARAFGFDIAEDLVEVARHKAAHFLGGVDGQGPVPLFPAHFGFVDRYNDLIRKLLTIARGNRRYVPPEFFVGDACDIPLCDSSVEHVNCCGSTLSFVPDHEAALAEIARVVKPRGTVMLEVEARWNMDVLWTLVDVLCKGRLGYDSSLRDAWSTIVREIDEHVMVDYPFREGPERVYIMKIKLFAVRRLRKELRQNGLRALRTWTIHSLTNVIPSTLLHSTNPAAWVKVLFWALSRIEEVMPVPIPGCSVVLLAEKVE